ncbi:MAG: AarF/UbiB family protein, partial [Candidatus Omnitrophota bacterium]
MLGIRAEKPDVIMKEGERLNADLSGLKDILAVAQRENFRTYGRRRIGRMLDALFYGGEGTAGILTDSASFGRISGALFDHATSGLSQTQKDGFRHIWDAVLGAADQDKRRDIYANLITAIAGKQGAVPYADLTRIFLETCGMAGVKMGQYLSMSGELLGLDIELRNALNSLTDKAKPLSRLTAMRIMSADLDRDHGIRRLMPDRVEKNGSIKLKLEKSASIKVTALVEMTDSTVRVVKVKRPEAAQELEKEKKFLAKAFENLRASGFLDNVALPQNVIDILGAMLTQEVDFTHEARAQKELTENLNRRSRGVFVRAYRFMKGLAGKRVTVKIPNSTWVSKSGNIMLEEFAKGNGLEKDSSIRFEIASELMKQLFVDGVYHADAHAGNILVDTDSGTVYFIDLGCTGRINAENRKALWSLFTSLSRKEIDAEGVIRFIDSIVRITDDQRSVLRNKIRTDISGKDLGLATSMAMVFVLMDSMKIKYSDEFGYVFKFFLSSSYIFDNLPKSRQIVIFAEIGSRIGLERVKEMAGLSPPGVAPAADLMGKYDVIGQVTPVNTPAIVAVLADEIGTRRATDVESLKSDPVAGRVVRVVVARAASVGDTNKYNNTALGISKGLSD